jgi:hypothetical protein
MPKVAGAMINTYTCPVCAYAMSEPVEEGNICPCCGTEFGYDDDLGVTYGQLRQLWIERGCAWFSPVAAIPDNWDPILQLIEADFDFDMASDKCVTTSRTTSSRVEGTRFEELVA